MSIEKKLKKARTKLDNLYKEYQDKEGKKLATLVKDLGYSNVSCVEGRCEGELFCSSVIFHRDNEKNDYVTFFEHEDFDVEEFESENKLNRIDKNDSSMDLFQDIYISKILNLDLEAFIVEQELC